MGGIPPYRKIAAELAPVLDKLIDAYIHGKCIVGGVQHRELSEFLWDHKMSILRVLQGATPRKQQHASDAEGSER